MDSLFKKYKPLNQIYINELYNYVRLNNRSSVSKENVRSLVEDWGISKRKIMEDSLFFTKLKKSNASLEEMEDWERSYINKNKEYNMAFDSIFIRDQKSERKTGRT